MQKYQAELLEQSHDLVSEKTGSGKVIWECPSNIAIVKYWGKLQNQIPRNPSISFSLKTSVTKTRVEYTENSGGNEPKINFLFEGKENQKFQSRIEKFINSVSPYFPFLKKMNVNIHSENTFPHSAGIASSASSLSSIALSLCSIEKVLFNSFENEEDFYKKASFISRLGSGSASRSVYPKWTLWGKSEFFENSSNEYAIPIVDVHPVFNEIHDTVLIVSSGKKPVSSSVGHEMMNNHAFSISRIEQANRNCENLYSILKSGELDAFIKIAENEALTLHALMMSSNPGYLLLHPNSISIIEKIKSFREETKLPVGFTIDAGPNIHLIYFSKDKELVDNFVETELSVFCENNQWINDRIGNGPKKEIS